MTDELKADLAELVALNLQRASNRRFVERRIAELRTEVGNLEKKSSVDSATKSEPVKVSANPTVTHGQRPLKKLTTFGYDESDKFVKLYYTLNGVQDLPADAVSARFTDDSFVVTVKDLKGYDYEVSAKGLTAPIDVSRSIVKQKTDNLLVMLKKEKEGEAWVKLLKLDKLAEKKSFKANIDDSDPHSGVMSMMKQMYDEGDDEMKRNIKKAMFESRNNPGGKELEF